MNPVIIENNRYPRVRYLFVRKSATAPVNLRPQNSWISSKIVKEYSKKTRPSDINRSADVLGT